MKRNSKLFAELQLRHNIRTSSQEKKSEDNVKVGRNTAKPSIKQL